MAEILSLSETSSILTDSRETCELNLLWEELYVSNLVFV